MASPLEELSLASYLSDPSRESLRRELDLFPEKMRYYLGNPLEHALQGDVYDQKHFVVTRGNGEIIRRLTRIMIVSNSCDISGENERPLPVSVLVAPLASMAKLRETFAKGGYAKDSIESRLRSIRMQETTDMFFLPGGGELEEDSVVLLDAIQAVRREFLQLPDKRLCTLSQAAFYMLLIKLSVHLCRAGERIDREAA